MVSDSHYRTDVAVLTNRPEDSPLVLVSHVHAHGYSPGERFSATVRHLFRSTIADIQVFENC